MKCVVLIVIDKYWRTIWDHNEKAANKAKSKIKDEKRDAIEKFFRPMHYH